MRRDQTVARYEQTIQTAFPGSLLTRCRRAAASPSRSRPRTQLVTATRRSLTLAEARYEQGADDYL